MPLSDQMLRSLMALEATGHPLHGDGAWVNGGGLIEL